MLRVGRSINCDQPSISSTLNERIFHSNVVSAAFFYLLFGFEFLAPIFSTKNGCVKRWWNWLQVDARWAHLTKPFDTCNLHHHHSHQHQNISFYWHTEICLMWFLWERTMWSRLSNHNNDWWFLFNTLYWMGPLKVIRISVNNNYCDYIKRIFLFHLSSVSCDYLLCFLTYHAIKWYVLIILVKCYRSSILGGNSQNFLRKFLIFFVTLGLTILRL